MNKEMQFVVYSLHFFSKKEKLLYLKEMWLIPFTLLRKEKLLSSKVTKKSVKCQQENLLERLHCIKVVRELQL
jgi:hypothetical protein